MLATNSSIPTTVSEGFNLSDLPHRASTLNEEILGNIFGGQSSGCQVQTFIIPGEPFPPSASCVNNGCSGTCVLINSGSTENPIFTCSCF